MPALHLTWRHALKRVTRALRGTLALHNPALRMAMPQRSWRSLRLPARLCQSSPRKAIWPRAFPFPPKASNLVYPAAPRTELQAQMEEQAAVQRAAAELRRATAAEKIKWT